MVRLGYGLRMGLFVLLLAAPRGARAADAPPADSTASPPAATSPTPSGSIHVLLRNGAAIEAERVQPNGIDVLKLKRPAARDTFVYTKSVEKITDEAGNNRTREVLRDWREVRVGHGPDAPASKAPPGERGPFVSFQVGGALPVGSTSDGLTMGPGVGASIYWRTNRRDSYGASVDFDQLRGDHELENALSAATGGQVDRLRYTSMSAGGLAQWLVLPDRRVTPFLHFGIRLGAFRSSLSGPSESGSATSFAFTRELGLGLRTVVSPRSRLDLLAGYTDTNVSQQTATAGVYNLTTKGHARYIQLRVGWTRRL